MPSQSMFSKARDISTKGSLVNVTMRVQQIRPKWMTDQREFNKIVNWSLDVVAKIWIKRFLPNHFEFKAFSLYGYKQRSAKWNKYKRKMYRRGVPYVHPEHEKPFIFTGELREHIRKQANSGSMFQASRRRRSVTRNSVQLRVPIDVRRPSKYFPGQRFGINPRHAGMLGRTNPTEQNYVFQQHIQVLQSMLDNAPTLQLRKTVR